MRPTYQPSKADLEESITLPQMSLEEAGPRLVRQVEIHYIDRPRHESQAGCVLGSHPLGERSPGLAV